MPAPGPRPCLHLLLLAGVLLAGCAAAPDPASHARPPAGLVVDKSIQVSSGAPATYRFRVTADAATVHFAYNATSVAPGQPFDGHPTDAVSLLVVRVPADFSPGDNRPVRWGGHDHQVLGQVSLRRGAYNATVDCAMPLPAACLVRVHVWMTPRTDTQHAPPAQGNPPDCAPVAPPADDGLAAWRPNAPDDAVAAVQTSGRIGARNSWHTAANASVAVVAFPRILSPLESQDHVVVRGVLDRLEFRLPPGCGRPLEGWYAMTVPGVLRPVAGPSNPVAGPSNPVAGNQTPAAARSGTFERIVDQDCDGWLAGAVLVDGAEYTDDGILAHLRMRVEQRCSGANGYVVRALVEWSRPEHCAASPIWAGC